MLAFGAIALAMGASVAQAETMSVQGRDIEVTRMDCASSTPPAGTFSKCLIGSTFIGCENPSDLCMKKNFRFASCRPISRGVPDNWDNPRIILCADDAHPDSHAPAAPVVQAPVVPAPVVTVPEPEDTHSHVDVHVPTPELKEATPVPVKTVAAPAAGGHDHAKDHDPEEGTNCLHSDLFDTVTGEEKCQCAGNLWRCADKDDPITKACDVGAKCIRKNAFYALCVDPNSARAAELRAGCEYDMTELPCGVHVGEYRTDKLLKRGECPA